jgi:hypothetical protein
MLLIIAWAAREYVRPPSPDPAAAMPFARLRRVVNHCGAMTTLPTNWNPIPQPKQMPCERNKCHISDAKDAAMNDAVSKKTPIRRVVRVPYKRVVIVATGEMISAWEMDSPPMNAYSRAVALGNMLLER